MNNEKNIGKNTFTLHSQGRSSYCIFHTVCYNQTCISYRLYALFYPFTDVRLLHRVMVAVF